MGLLPRAPAGSVARWPAPPGHRREAGGRSGRTETSRRQGPRSFQRWGFRAAAGGVPSPLPRRWV